jgi:DNA-binding NtrC family response regulator
MSKARILICDDEIEILSYLRKILVAKGVGVETFTAGTPLLRYLANNPNEEVDLLLLDIRMPDMDGIRVLEQIRKLELEIPVLIMTAHASISSAVEAIKLGAYDYVTKPFPKEKVLGVLEHVIERKLLRQENQALKEELGKPTSLKKIVFTSSRFREVYDMARQVAASDANVLILGDSGTGKELIAGLIHANSPRKGQSFLSLNCAALSETLLESQLFGHVRGAFTGAITPQKGLLEEADGGSLFLDEIGDMSLPLQAKLLRVLQERDFIPVGATRPKSVDVRFIAATNKELAREVKEGRFREDLFYRLNVIPINLPPLRERKEDIEPLARHFLAKFRQHMKKEVTDLTPEAIRKLTDYSWPGNIRELENVIERAVILARTPLLTPDQLPLLASEPPPVDQDRQERLITLATVEREHIQHVLKKTGYHKSRTARILGIARRTLDRKIEEFGLDDHLLGRGADY